MIRRVVDVRPVKQRSHATVERLEGSGVVPDTDIFRPVVATNTAEHHGEVVVERATWEHAANGRLPRVPMGVDEPRHDDHPGRVDLFDFGRLETASDLGDL